MREAGRIITETMNKALSRLVPGVRQFEVIADVYRDQVMGVDGKFGDYTGLCPLIQVGEGTSTASNMDRRTATSKRPRGHGVRRGAPSLPRTFDEDGTYRPSVGEDVQLADAIVESGDLAIGGKTRATCEEVEAIWQRALNRHGFEKKSRVGYSIGLNYPPDWGERTASLRPGDQTVLKEGMCFHFQSGVWLEDFGAAISEPFIVTPAGGERITDVSRSLVVV